MRKLVMMTAVILLGVAGSLWADSLNPQPLPPGAKNSSGGDGGIVMPSSSSSHDRQTDVNLTQHDQNQITGNVNGDGKQANGLVKGQGLIKGEGRGFKKAKGLYKGQGLIKSSYEKSGLADGSHSKASVGGGGGPEDKAGFQDLHHSSSGNGTQKVLIGLNKANNFKKANGLQKANSLQKNGSFQKNGALGDGSFTGGVKEGVVIQGGTQAQGH